MNFRSFQTLAVMLTTTMVAMDAFGETLVLSIERSCDTLLNQFTCEPSTKTAEIYFKNGTWYGIKDERTKDAEPLIVLRDDQYILILSNPVLFSGTSIVHIMKATGHFYWNEVSYSESLNAEANHVKIGRIKRK